MQRADLTLEAALRDLHSPREGARHRALRNLAPALLEALDRPGPLWRATEAHARGSEVLAALHAAVQDDDAAIASLAAVGLGWLGDPALHERVAPWLALAGDGEELRFRRECAVIALGMLGAAAPRDEPLRADIARTLQAALRTDAPDLRFQAAEALVDVDDPEAVERGLVEALAIESHAEVREGFVVALSRLDRCSPATLDRLEAWMRDDDATWTFRFEAALVLAAARRATALPVLREALSRRLDRDRALEALAALGRPEALPDVRRLAQRWFLPGVTRVRAAYAWARCEDPTKRPNPGALALARLAWHPRAAVREAVRDARAALLTLEARDGLPSGLLR